MLALVLALVSGFVPADCPACAVREDKAILCADHAREELIAVKRERLRFEKARTDAEKIAALETLAAITEPHANAPSSAVPRALAIGLLDPSEPVRTKALSLFAAPQNADASLDVLLKTRRDLASRSKLRGLDELDPRKSVGKALEEGIKDTEREMEAARWLIVRMKIDRQLVHFPDERVVKALADELEVYSNAMTVLATLGSRGALDPVARALERYGEVLRTETPQKDGTVAPGPHPGAELIAALEALAARHGIAPVPEAERRSSRAWSAWIEANRAAFPAKLPGVGALPVAAR